MSSYDFFARYEKNKIVEVAILLTNGDKPEGDWKHIYESDYWREKGRLEKERVDAIVRRSMDQIKKAKS